MVTKNELFHFSSGEFLKRPKRSTSYRKRHALHPEVPIVIDNGSYHCRVGWADEEEPRFDFRNLLSKPRSKATGQAVSIVGDYGTAVARAYEFSRSSVRSAFDGNVVYQYETMETILDYAFDRLGLTGGKVAHPLLMTECPCNPLYARTKMAELAFEAYGVPALAFAVDAPLSHAYNRRKGNTSPDGLLVSAGHSATHVIPMLGGKPLWEATCRAPIGGLHITDFLFKRLSLLYPQHATSLSWERGEEMKQRHCYVAEDYLSELGIFQRGGAEAEERTMTWQLAWVAPPEPDAVTAEEIARKAAVKERAGQRLRDMAAAKKAQKAAELEHTVAGLEALIAQLDGLSSSQVSALLAEAEFDDRADLEGHLAKAAASLKKARGDPMEEPPAPPELPDSERYPLLEIPDKELAPDQLKEKRKQRLLKSAAEGRARARQRKEEARQLAEQERQLDEQRRLEDPEAYLVQLREKFQALQAKLEQRKRHKGAAAIGGTGGAAAGAASAPGGRGERLTAAQRERMKLLTTAAFDKGKGDDDTFGMEDDDWLLYKKMGRDDEGNNEDAEEEEAELARMAARLQELDPSFMPTGDVGSTSASGGGQVVGSTAAARPTEKDFQIRIGTERIRAPEILFQPSIVAVDQAGLGELLQVALRRTPHELRDRVRRGKVFLTGGSMKLPGIQARIVKELRRTRPLDEQFEIVKAYDPSMDAWHGAAAMASSSKFRRQTFTKEEYDERGPDWLRKYCVSYSSF